MAKEKNPRKPSVLIIYTGGTIGMVENARTKALEPLEFSHLEKYVPELRRFGYGIQVHQFTPPIDSSSMQPAHWVDIARTITEHYDEFDGFVVLHGTDTMSYTASALSFMLENLSKPVILTGSQLPIGQIRTDGKENLITAVEIAAAQREDGSAMVPEVCVFFQSELLRGNRTTKIYAENFNAFRSYNYPALAKAGITIEYNEGLIRRPQAGKALLTHYDLESHIVVLTLFPGISEDIVRRVVSTNGIKAIILKTFGSGNAPKEPWLMSLIQEASSRGILIVNITQCQSGKVEMTRYETGLQLLDTGVISGRDATMESAITKLMVLLGTGGSSKQISELMNQDLAGEITI